MAEKIEAVLDHIAVAVPDRDRAERRWVDELGGRAVAWSDNSGFRSRQLRFTGGGKLELLEPPAAADERNFVRAFLDRFGAQPHHVTLKVPDLDEAVDTIRDAGLDVVDVRQDNPHWHEGFLRPSQVGGLVVQVAWSASTDEQWAADLAHVRQAPRPDGPVLVGLILHHPELEAAAELWTLLGAGVEPGQDQLVCSWPHSPVGVVIRPGERPAAGGLLFANTAPLAAEEGIGPAVEVL